MTRRTLEGWIAATVFGYESAALVPGSPLPPITRLVAPHWFRWAVVLAVLLYHFWKYQQLLRGVEAQGQEP